MGSSRLCKPQIPNLYSQKQESNTVTLKRGRKHSFCPSVDAVSSLQTRMVSVKVSNTQKNSQKKNITEYGSIPHQASGNDGFFLCFAKSQHSKHNMLSKRTWDAVEEGAKIIKKYRYLICSSIQI